MDQPRFKNKFSRGKQTSTSEQRWKTEKKSSAGAHELFLEYEGFLAPSNPGLRRPPTAVSEATTRQNPAPNLIPPRPSTTSSKATTLLNPQLCQGTNVKLSEETLRSSTITQSKPHKSFSGLRSAIEGSQSLPQEVPSRRKKGFFSLGRRVHGPPEEDPSQISQSTPNHVADAQSSARSPASGWLRRYMSTSVKKKGSSAEAPVPEMLPYHESPIYEDEYFTALPAFPGCNPEQPQAPEKLPNGAAARAAAAAQNEMLDSMRNLRLAEPPMTRDSESGVGIEVRDREEVMVEFDIPVVRKDPLSILPEELVGHILSFLDAGSLTNAELVSHGWNQSASSYHVWREVFLAEFQEVSQISAVTPWSGPGLGKETFDQDWKSMWRARKALQQRWIDGYAAAIYLEGHTDSVYCVQFDENKILTGSRDRTVRIWDAHTYECIKVLGVPSRSAMLGVPPLPIEETEQGHRPFKTVFSPRVKMESNALPPSLYHHGSILCLQYDDDIMITGSSDFTLIVWDIKADYKPIRRLRNHTAGVLDVCFDNKHIVSCSKDATVCLWDRHTGQLLRRLSGHHGPVNAVQLRGDLVVSASGDGIAKLWNLTSGLCIKQFQSKDRGMACVEFSPDSRTILAGGNDQVIYQFDTNTGELVREMSGHEGLVRSLHLDSASGRVVSGSYDTSVKAYDLRSGETIVNFTKWTSSWILSAKADYRRIIATSQDSRAVIMDFGYQLPGIESLEA